MLSWASCEIPRVRRTLELLDGYHPRGAPPRFRKEDRDRWRGGSRGARLRIRQAQRLGGIFKRATKPPRARGRNERLGTPRELKMHLESAHRQKKKSYRVADYVTTVQAPLQSRIGAHILFGVSSRPRLRDFSVRLRLGVSARRRLLYIEDSRGLKYPVTLGRYFDLARSGMLWLQKMLWRRRAVVPSLAGCCRSM